MTQQKFTDKELLDPARLVEAFLAAGKIDITREFITDLLTHTQIEQCVRKLFAAYKISKGASYEFLQETTGLSSTTIAGISKKLKNNGSGYSQVLGRLYPGELGRLDDPDYALEEFKAFLSERKQN